MILNISNSLHNFNIDPLLNGNDIKELTGFTSSPQIGDILNELISLESSGQIVTKKDAIKWLKTRENID